jgi:hypothetical protein
MTNWLSIPGDDDVALMHARLGPWPFRIDAHHHHASSTSLRRDKLEAETEIAARNMAVFLKPRRDTFNGGGRDHEDAPARSEHRHANRAARSLNGETTFGTPPHAKIKFDPSIDLTAS